MASKPIDITREESLIMRGMAIVLIMLHNYCHQLSFTVLENESSFSKDNVYAFFDKVTIPSDEWIYDFFSFLGWYGVPVFVFLSGFGLVKKYEVPGAKEMDRSHFLFDNWLKLLALLLPAVIYYVGEDIVRFFLTGGKWYLADILPKLFLLTFLNDIFGILTDILGNGNILGFLTRISPTIYWYFGLTLEFYFLYAFVVYKKRVRLLLLLTFVSIALQLAAHKGVLGDAVSMLWWVRQNITGWMVPFTFGILYARVHTFPRAWIYTIIAVSILLFFPVMTDPLLWQISLLCAIILSIVAAKVSFRIRYWRNFWIWTGRLSPFLFVTTPIVRTLVFENFSTLYYEPDGWVFIFFIISLVVSAIIYKAVWNYMTPRLRVVIDKIVCFF